MATGIIFLTFTCSMPFSSLISLFCSISGGVEIGLKWCSFSSISVSFISFSWIFSSVLLWGALVFVMQFYFSRLQCAYIYTGSPTSNLTIPGAYFSILPIIFWCLKYVFIYSRYGHFIIYHHFLTYARHFFTNQFFFKKFFFSIFFSKTFFLHLMNHKLMSKIRFYMHKTMKFYDLLPFFDLS